MPQILDTKKWLDQGFTRKYEIWAVGKNNTLLWRRPEYWNTLTEAIQGWIDFQEIFNAKEYRLVETFVNHRIIEPDDIEKIREDLKGDLTP